MIKLHHSPMSCSLASRFALVEAGVPHDVAIVRTWRSEQKAEDFIQINSRGQVPTLEVDGGVLTESSAILPYIADLVPEKALFPVTGSFSRAQGQAWLSFLSSSLHASIAAAMFPPTGCEEETAKRVATDRAASAFRHIDEHLEGRDGLLDGFSVCDLYLSVFALWRASPVLASRMPALPNIDRVVQAVLARPGLMGIVSEDMAIRAQTPDPE